MKVLKKSLKEGFIQILVEDAEDLWHLRRIIAPEDIVKGKSTRKVKVTEKESVKKQYYFELKAEKTSYESGALRINGIILNEIEDVPKGSHQNITVQEGDSIKIEKAWTKYYLEMLDKAVKRAKLDYLLVLFDREEANFYELKGSELKSLGSLQGEVEKKDYKVASRNFYKELLQSVEKMDSSSNYNKIILAAAQFWLDEIKKELTSSKITKKAMLLPVSGTEKASVKELLLRPEVKKELLQLKSLREIALVEELLKQIKIGEKYAYGMKDVKNALQIGAVDTLMISSELIDKMIEEDSFEVLNGLMEQSLGKDSALEIIESDKNAVMQLNSLGGIAALLRFRIS